jgi:Ion channel
MIAKTFFALILLAGCVSIHAAGLSAAFRWMPRRREFYVGYWHWTGVFVCLAAWMILLHLLEIAVWALFFHWNGTMPDAASALYFSAVTYTTTGYGDLVLPHEWRLLSGVEALTGILMCGWSTGFFFAVVTRMFDSSSTAGIGRR